MDLNYGLDSVGSRQGSVADFVNMKLSIVFLCYYLEISIAAATVMCLQGKRCHLNVMANGCLKQKNPSRDVPVRAVSLQSATEQCYSALRIHNMVQARKGGGCLIRQ
jgi:hypothetical protein